MNIGEAVELMKAGHRMRNSHWPTPMYVVYQKGYPDGIPINANTAEALGKPEGTMCAFRPYLMLHTVVEDEFVPYVATQSDLLTDCWEEFRDGAGLTEEEAIEKGYLPRTDLDD